MRDEILTVIREVLAPMVVADGGRLYVIHADAERVALHLAGRFAGCPGNQVATERVIQPAIAAVAPQAELTVTWGRLVPSGATRVDTGADSTPSPGSSSASIRNASGADRSGSGA